MINKVTKEECLDAIEYLYGMGFVEEMTTDKKWAVEILLKKVANDYNLDLSNRTETTWQDEVFEKHKDEPLSDVFKNNQ